MSDPVPTPVPERSTRDRLIDAAVAVVARDGLESASVKVIAAEAAIAPGLLHYHFAGKDALMEAALRRALAEYQARLRERRAGRDPAEQLEGYFADALSAVAADADFFRVRLAFAARALTHPELARVLREVNAAGAEETALTFAAAAGREQPTAEERLLATTLKAAFDGVMLAWLNDPAIELEGVARVLAHGARSWLALHTR